MNALLQRLDAHDLDAHDLDTHDLAFVVGVADRHLIG
jgi:hypothetical protein